MLMIKSLIPGVLLCVLVAIAALFLSSYVAIGAVTIAIGIGVFIKIPVEYLRWFDSGIMFCEKHVLAFAVTLLGISLDYKVLNQLGFRSIGIILLVILWTIISSIIIGRFFRLPKATSILLGIGNAICGSAAIAATKDLTSADKEEVGISIAIVNFLGAIGMFFIPAIGIQLLHLSSSDNGLLIGSTLQAVGHVVAAGFSVDPNVGQAAVTVKLVRVLMLPLVTLALIFLLSKGTTDATKSPNKNPFSLVPWFIYGFLVLSLLPLFGVITPETQGIVAKVSKYALVIAMVGIGIRIELRSLLNVGKHAFFAGTIIFLFQIIFAAVLISIQK